MYVSEDGSSSVFRPTQKSHLPKRKTDYIALFEVGKKFVAVKAA
jgi:hypothetical protein